MQLNFERSIKLKFMLIGDPQVGKSAIFQRLTSSHDKPLEPSYQPTDMIAFATKRVKISDKTYEFFYWDTEGHEKSLEITKSYLRHAQIVACVFDLTNEESFKNVQRWIQIAKEITSEGTEYMLVGNKKDLQEERKVSHDEGVKQGELYGMKYFEVSGKDCSGIEEFGNEVRQKMIQGYENKSFGNAEYFD